MDDYESNPVRLKVVLYFALSTLSTVGYGDKVPISNIEKASVILSMLGGVLFFTYVMAMFDYMVRNYQ